MTVADHAPINELVEHYRDRLAGAYGLEMLHDRVAADEVCDSLVQELGHRPAPLLAQMVVFLLNQPARRDALRMVRSVTALPGVCPDPALHARLERVAAQEMRLPSLAPEGACSWCGGAL